MIKTHTVIEYKNDGNPSVAELVCTYTEGSNITFETNTISKAMQVIEQILVNKNGTSTEMEIITKPNYVKVTLKNCMGEN